jgi:hypothetical protein
MALQPRVQTMRRREFVTLLGSAAVTWPALARAQQSTIPTVGFLSTRSPDESAHQLAAFHRGLAENGYVENQNVTVEYRWAMGQYDQMAPLAAELVRRSVGVLVAVGGDPSARERKDVQPVLHDQAVGRRHRPWPLHQPRHHRQAARRLNRSRYAAARVHRNQGYFAPHCRVAVRSLVIVPMSAFGP